ncbi:MAG TPA: hypothetical protein PKM88_03955 [bacterium]|nr:hypothetical protein [bacterium]
MKLRPAMLLLVLLALPAAAEPADTGTEATLVRRVELLLERSEAERRRLEGELLLRERQTRADCAAQLAAKDQELAALRAQLAGSVSDSAAAGVRAENAKLAGELQRVMLTPLWTQAATQAAQPLDGVLDVNAASRDQLMMVPGMTAAGADFILWYRERVGPITGTAELRFIPAATAALCEQWRRLLRAE